MVTDDLFFRVLETTRDLNALTMVHCENGWAIDVLVERALAAGQTDPIYHARTRPEIARGRGDRTAPCGSPSSPARASSSSTSPAGWPPTRSRAGQARGVQVSGETCLQYLTNTVDDLERPDFEGARYVCSPPLREQRNQELLWARAATAACSRASRPTTARSTASRRRSAATTSRRSPTAWR